MKATLQLEYIGERQDAEMVLYQRMIDEAIPGLGSAFIDKPRIRMPWVAEIIGRHKKFGLDRRFIAANWQRTRANSTHSRGVELWFVLESGRCYQVRHFTSWRNLERYFCRVTRAGEIVRMNNEEVEAWLNGHLALMS